MNFSFRLAQTFAPTVIFFTINFCLTSCATYNPPPRTAYDFVKEVHFSGDRGPSAYQNEAQAYCSTFGLSANYKSTRPGSLFADTEFTHHFWKCEQSGQPPLNNNSNNVNANNGGNTSTSSSSFQQCKKIGFTEGTTNFSDCLLKLDLFEKEAKIRAEEYRLAKEEADMAANTALIQMGLGMASGQNVGQAKRSPVYQPPSPLIFTSPRGSVVCNFMGNLVTCN